MKLMPLTRHAALAGACPPLSLYVWMQSQVYWHIGDSSPHPPSLGWLAYVRTFAYDLWRMQDTTGTTLLNSAYPNPGPNATISGLYTLHTGDGPLVGQATDSILWRGGTASATSLYQRWAPPTDPEIGEDRSYTILFWAKWTSGTPAVLVEWASGTLASTLASFQTLSNGHLRWVTYIATLDTPLAYNDGAWHLFAGVLSHGGRAPDGEMLLYVDGAQVATAVANFGFLDDGLAIDAHFGADSGGLHPYAGKLSEVLFSLDAETPNNMLGIWQSGQNLPTVHIDHPIAPYGIYVGPRTGAPDNWWNGETREIVGDGTVYHGSANDVWMYGQMMRYSRGPAPQQATNEGVWAGRFNRQDGLFDPIWWVDNPPAGPDQTPGIIGLSLVVGGIQSAVSDGGAGMYAIAFQWNQASGLRGECGVIVHWPGPPSIHASSDLTVIPFPTATNWPGRHWRWKSYFNGGGPYTPQLLYDVDNFDANHPSPPPGWNTIDVRFTYAYSLMRIGSAIWALARDDISISGGRTVGAISLLRSTRTPPERPASWDELAVWCKWDLNDPSTWASDNSLRDPFGAVLGREWMVQRANGDYYWSTGISWDTTTGSAPHDPALFRYMTQGGSYGDSMALPAPRGALTWTWGGMLAELHGQLYGVTVEANSDTGPAAPVVVRLWGLTSPPAGWTAISEWVATRAAFSSLRLAQLISDGVDFLAMTMELDYNDPSTLFILSWKWQAGNGPGTWFNCAAGQSDTTNTMSHVRMHVWF